MEPKNTYMATAFLILFAFPGCGRLGITSKYTADTRSAASDEIGKSYYTTVEKAVTANKAVAEKFADAAKEMAKSIGTPILPPEAFNLSHDLQVQGDSKTFLVRQPPSPPDAGKIAAARTAQVQAWAFGARKLAQEARVDIAAPPGYTPAGNQPAPWDDIEPDWINDLPDNKTSGVIEEKKTDLKK